MSIRYKETTAQLVLNPNTAITTSKTSFAKMLFFLIAFAILLSDLLMMIGHCLSLISKRNQQTKELLRYQINNHYINHSKRKSYTPSNPIPIPLHEVTQEHALKEPINSPLKEHFWNTVRVQPFPSYFGYIMHNNILMMLDLVAVTEY